MICVVEAKSRSDDGKLNNFSPIKPYFWIIGVAGYFGNMDLVVFYSKCNKRITSNYNSRREVFKLLN
jgi:hypothetical protein